MGNTVVDPLTDRAVHQFAERVKKRFDVTSSILFGSRARQTHSADSDADVAVILRGSASGDQYWPVKLAMIDIAYDVLLETEVHIQPLPIWEREWVDPESYSNPKLLEAIAEEGIYL